MLTPRGTQPDPDPRGFPLLSLLCHYCHYPVPANEDGRVDLGHTLLIQSGEGQWLGVDVAALVTLCMPSGIGWDP
jgi:hypothetical protein